jgi:hypothetical protein
MYQLTSSGEASIAVSSGCTHHRRRHRFNNCEHRHYRGNMERQMRRYLIVITAIGISSLIITTGETAFAQDAGGIVLCIAACSKADKGCQDRCLPARGMRGETKSCIEGCRQRASEPDLVVGLTKCVNRCLGEAASQ